MTYLGFREVWAWFILVHSGCSIHAELLSLAPGLISKTVLARLGKPTMVPSWSHPTLSLWFSTHWYGILGVLQQCIIVYHYIQSLDCKWLVKHVGTPWRSYLKPHVHGWNFWPHSHSFQIARETLVQLDCKGLITVAHLCHDSSLPEVCGTLQLSTEFAVVLITMFIHVSFTRKIETSQRSWKHGSHGKTM